MPSTKALIDIFLRPRGKRAFIADLSTDTRVLDVGCGNGSDLLFKNINSGPTYHGIDICPRPKSFCGARYVESSAGEFNDDVSKELPLVDTVISAHNLEHCNDYQGLVRAIARAPTLSRLFMSFPSEVSTTLPRSRFGTLNFFQDPTHREVPDLKFITSELVENGWRISYCANPYRPLIPRLIGFFWWPIFRLTGIESPLYGTYSFYGFEAVVWADRIPQREASTG